jgi:hypothetical protein
VAALVVLVAALVDLFLGSGGFQVAGLVVAVGVVAFLLTNQIPTGRG